MAGERTAHMEFTSQFYSLPALESDRRSDPGSGPDPGLFPLLSDLPTRGNFESIWDTEVAFIY